MFLAKQNKDIYLALLTLSFYVEYIFYSATYFKKMYIYGEI